MKQGTFTVLEQREVAPNVWDMRLAGDVSAVANPGQFVNIALPGRYLRRPISVCDCTVDAGNGAAGLDGDSGTLRLIYKVVGHGTEDMSTMPAGMQLDILTGLGNGYDLAAAGDAPLFVGGGVGTPPLFWAAKQLRAAGKNVTVILGFNVQSEIFLADEFEALGCEVHIATMDGSVGTKGFVTDALAALVAQDKRFSHFYACGPLPMLRALCLATDPANAERCIQDIPGEVSMEERMGCGFGACMGCSLQTASGAKRVCKEGPVFAKEDLQW